MKISAVHSFLVQPAKRLDPQPDASGTEVPMKGQLFSMLQDLWERAPSECRIEIMFRPNQEGEPINEARALLQAYASDPSLENGRTVAERLQSVTTKRSGLGLLFLFLGEMPNGIQGLLISRFPAEQGILAQEHAGRLDVEFIERVFMKNTKAYKSVIFQTTTLAAGFQEGRAVDRQLSGPRELSQYWIGDFLDSDLRTTGPFGSRRLGEALRNAVNATEKRPLKEELIWVTQLLRNQDGRTRSARAFLERLGLSDEGMNAVVRAFARPELIDESFRFEADEFSKHISYRMVELNNGAMLMAEDARFDEVFQYEPVVAERTELRNNIMRYSTEGEVINQRYRKKK